MPQAIVVAGIGAAAGLGGAALASGAQRSAQRSQQRSTDQAIALQREQEAEARRRYDQQWELYNQQMQQREAIRRQLLRQRGIDIPDPTASLAQNNRINEPGGKLTLGSMMPGGANLPPGATDVGMQKLPVGGGAPAGPVGAIPAPDSGGLGPPLVPQGQQGMTLGDLSGWSDWGRYTGQPAR